MAGQRLFRRKPKFEPCAASRMICNGDAATMRDDDRAANREADAHTGTLGCEEAVEDAVQVLVGNSRSAVMNRDNGPVLFALRNQSYSPQQSLSLRDGLDAV